MIRRAKALDMMKVVFYNPFEHIWLQSILTFKIMDFENVPLKKIIHIYVIEVMNA
jgi:hypothetical protein